MVTAAHNVFRGTRVCVWAAQNTQNIGLAHRARQRVPGAYGVAQISPWWLLGPPVASPPILLPPYKWQTCGSRLVCVQERALSQPQHAIFIGLSTNNT